MPQHFYLLDILIIKIHASYNIVKKLNGRLVLSLRDNKTSDNENVRQYFSFGKQWLFCVISLLAKMTLLEQSETRYFINLITVFDGQGDFFLQFLFPQYLFVQCHVYAA